MITETRPRRRHEAKPSRYSPIGAFVLALVLTLADAPKPADAEERDRGDA